MLDYVTVTGGVMTDEEIQAYVDHVQEKNPQRKLKALNIEMDGEFVNLNYTFEAVSYTHLDVYKRQLHGISQLVDAV